MDDRQARIEAIRYASNAISSAGGMPSDVLPLAKKLYAFMNGEPEKRLAEWQQKMTEFAAK